MGVVAKRCGVAGPALRGVATPAGFVGGFKTAPDAPADVQVRSGAAAWLTIADWEKWYEPDLFWLVADDGRVLSLTSVRQALGGSGPGFKFFLEAGH